jgi:hypothetical protein
MSKVMNYSTKYLQDTDPEQRPQKDNVSSLQQNETKHKTILRRQVKVYATSSAGSVEAGVLEEGAEVTGSGVEGVGAGRIRDTSLGAYSFAFLKKLLHFRWRSSVRRAHFLPIHFLSMRLGQSDRPFDTLPHRQKLQLKNRIFRGIESLD